MALITCKDCGKQFSTDAKYCVHCGAKRSPPSVTAADSIKFILKFIFAIWLFGSLLFAGHRSTDGNPKISACVNDWKQCSDNAELVNHYQEYFHIQYACKIAAESAAKYGTPEFSLGLFGSYLPREDFVKTGIIEPTDIHVKFQNMFGAMVNSRASCIYDLNQNKVIDIQISDE